MDSDNNTIMEYEYVTKRNGEKEKVYFDKINARIEKLCEGLKINPTRVTRDITKEMYNGIHTWELDELGAQIAASLCTEHPDYNTLASRIIISNHHKNTSPSFSETMSILYNNTDVHGKQVPLISRELFDVSQKHSVKLNDTIKNERDYYFDYFGFKTLERSYLMRLKNSDLVAGGKQNIKGKIVERPQHMLMRVSLGIHGENLKEAINTYNLMSNKYFIHATPTLFNAGTNRPQLSSCFLLAMKDDSIDGIYSTLRDCALISKWAGGIGLHTHNIRAKNSAIRGTNGISNGLVPMLRVFNNTARYVDQCFSFKTRVFTPEGYKRIQDIVPNNYVLTNDGSYQRVLKNVVHNYWSGDVYNVLFSNNLDYSKNVVVTPEHPLYSIRNYDNCTNTNNLIFRLQSKLIKPDYNEVKNLSKGDYVGFPILDTFNDVEIYTPEICRFIGILMSHGGTETGGNFGAIFTENDSESFQFMLGILDKNFVKYKTTYDNETKITNIVWNQSSFNDISMPLISNGFHNNLLNLPPNKTIELLYGIFKKYSKLSVGNNKVFITVNNKKFMHQILYMTNKLMIYESEVLQIENGIGHKIVYPIDIYSINFFKHIFTREKLQQIETDNFVWQKVFYRRIIDKKLTKWVGNLYDFEIENNHNYTTELGLAHNGGGKRNGSIAIYLEPWHSDIFDFLLLKKNHGNEEDRARDLFYALWISDLFMKRVKSGGNWTLFCPDEAPGLSDTYGEEFEELYEKYEAEGRGKKTIEAQKLWTAILESQIETGTPYMVYKDACNKKSNQKNLGTIKSSNLCTEIVEYSSSDQFAVCNLASIGLPRFIENRKFDFDKLEEVVKTVTRNLNRVIDINFYPVPETKRSNSLHRPIGIGVQGLADVFAKLEISFSSEQARKLNNDIFETIYYASLTASMELAKEREEIVKEYKEYSENEDLYTSMTENETEYDAMLEKMRREYHIIDEELERTEFLGSYSSFIGSPVYNGQLQFDMWETEGKYPLRHNWNELRESIKKYGIRNSLLLAPMPTASTSQILGNNECFEPITSNIYIRRTLAGEFIVINNHLINALIKLNMWNKEIKDKIIENNGSIQNIPGIPESIKDVFKTVWETSNKVLIDMAADRGRFICQSQSLNLFVEKPNFSNLSSMHMYAWKSGLKTGLYYLRTRPVAAAQKFTIEPGKKPDPVQKVLACSRDNPDCEACSA